MALRNRFKPATQETRSLTRETEAFGFFDHMPQDVINLIAGELPRQDRGSFACAGKRMARAARLQNLCEASVPTSAQLSAASAAFTSLDEVEKCLQQLTDYTYGFDASKETARQTQARLARSLKLITDSMCYIQHCTSLSFEFDKPDEDDDVEIFSTDITGYIPGHRNIGQQDINAIDQLVNKIESAAYSCTSTAALENDLKSNMAVMADTLRSLANALAIYNTTAHSSLLALLSCGLWRQPDAQETKLIRLLLACTNAVGHQLNELDKKILSTIRLIEPQCIYRR